MKLYSFVPQDCSGKVRWLLNELDLNFEEIKLSYKNGDTKSEAYLSKHPLGQVPVLEDGNNTVFESYAIVAYLADKYIERGLAPNPEDSQRRASYYQWLFFSANSAEDFFSRYQKLAKMTQEYRDLWGEYIQDKVQKILSAIETQLQSRNYILGEFSAVDTCLGYALDSVSEESFFNNYPNTKAYYARLASREACLKSEIFKRS